MPRVKTAQYVPGPEDRVEVKRFANGKAYILVGAHALNALGLIGTEYNGVAVIDADRQRVVCDNVDIGEGVAQRSRRIDQLMAMEWPAFAAFCTSARSYRGDFEDLDNPIRGPGEPNYTLQSLSGIPTADNGADISLPQTRAVPDDHASFFPARTRAEMIAEIAGHEFHAIDRYEPAGLSWSIKVGRFDTSGRPPAGDTSSPTNADLDTAWNTKVDGDREGRLFWAAAEEALRPFLDGEYAPFGEGLPAALAQPKLQTAGRSGGHLVLTELSDGSKLLFGSRVELAEFLDELTDPELAGLYHLVASLDYSLRPDAVRQEMEYQYHLLRQSWEEEMQAAPRPAV